MAVAQLRRELDRPSGVWLWCPGTAEVRRVSGGLESGGCCRGAVVAEDGAEWEGSELDLVFGSSAGRPSWMPSAWLLDGAATGRTRTALVEGEAGIGKSRLLFESLQRAREQGFRVLVGACDELERDRPLRALGEAFGVERGAADADRAELARLVPVRGGPIDR